VACGAFDCAINGCVPHAAVLTTLINNLAAAGVGADDEELCTSRSTGHVPSIVKELAPAMLSKRIVR